MTSRVRCPWEELVFSSASNFSIDGNIKICGGVEELKLPKCTIKGASKKLRASRGLKYILPTCIGIPALLLMFSAIFLYKRRNAERVSTSDGLLRNTFPKVSSGDLHRATDGFYINKFDWFGKVQLCV